MTQPQDENRETRAIDALIVAALRADLDTTPPDLDAPAPALTEEDRLALARLGPDFIARVLANPRESSHCSRATIRRELATAMNRGEEDAELTDAARKEMERRIEEEERKRQKGPSGADSARE